MLAGKITFAANQGPSVDQRLLSDESSGKRQSRCIIFVFYQELRPAALGMAGGLHCPEASRMVSVWHPQRQAETGMISRGRLFYMH